MFIMCKDQGVQIVPRPKAGRRNGVSAEKFISIIIIISINNNIFNMIIFLL